MDLSQQTTPTPMKATREMDQDRIQVCHSVRVKFGKGSSWLHVACSETSDTGERSLCEANNLHTYQLTNSVPPAC